MADITVIGDQLQFQGKVYRCAIGKGGFSDHKKEGDGCTPLGTFPLRECWYRADRMDAPDTKLPLKIIRENDGWCDDPRSALYNKHIRIAPPAGGRGRGGWPATTDGLGEGAYSTRQPEALQKAKALRRELTKPEKKLWYDVLTSKQLEGFKFRKQMPIGPYIADFVCVQEKLIIELDGGEHVENEQYDKERTAFLEGGGYRVVRFWNNEVMGNLEGVAEVIRAALRAAHPHPPLPPPQASGAKEGFERLWCDGHAYDLIVPLGYNDDPVVAGRGSAIFMHIAKPGYTPTEGCVALAKEDLLAILVGCDTKTLIEIREK